MREQFFTWRIGLVSLAICIVALAAAPAHGEVRTWTARTGNFSADAELVDVTAGQVKLQKRDGTIITVPLDRLSLADVKYVEKALKDATAAIGNSPAASEASAEERKASSTPSALRPVKSAPEPLESARPLSAKAADDGRGPPVARANSSQWQAHPDPGGDDGRSIQDVSISLPDGSGQLLVPGSQSRFIGYATSSPQFSIQSWDLRSGDRAGPISLEGFSTRHPALCSDGDLVALTAGSDPNVQIWSLKRRAKVQDISLGERNAHVQYMAFAGPKRLLVAGGFNTGLRIFDPRTGEESAKIPVESVNDDKHIAISPGGNYAALMDSFRSPLKIYDLRNGEVAGEPDPPASSDKFQSLEGMRFSADGQELAAIYRSGGSGLLCWSMRTGKITAQHELDKSAGSLGFSGDGTPAVEFIPGKGWLVEGKAVVDRKKGGPIWVSKSRVSSDGVTLRMLDAERMLVVTGGYRARKVTIEKLPWEDIGASAAVVEKGGTAADAGLPPLTKSDASKARVVELSAQNRPWRVTLEPQSREKLSNENVVVGQSSITGLPLIAPQGPRVVLSTISFDRSAGSRSISRFRCFNLQSGKEEGSLEVPNSGRALDINAEGTRLAVTLGQDQDRLDIYDLNGRHILALRPYQGEQSFGSRLNTAVLIKDDLLITIGGNGKLIAWSLPDCKALYAINQPLSRTVVFSPGRKFMILQSDGTLQVLDTSSGAPAGTLQSPEIDQRRFLSAYSFSADGKLLAAILRGTSRSTLVCWDFTNGKIVHQHEIETRDSVLFVSDKHLLLQLPLLEGRDVRGRALPPQRYDLIDLDSGRTLWRYQLSAGQIAPQTVGGLVWYVSAKELGQPVRLAAAAIPSSETLRLMAEAPAAQNLLPAGTAVTLDVTAKISGDAIADKVLQDDLKKKLTDYLTKRGLKVQDRSALALRVDVAEQLTGDLVHRRPIYGGVTGRYEIKGTKMTCKLQLVDISRKPLWSREEIIAARDDIPRNGIPKGQSASDYVRQQQWDDAIEFLTGGGIPAELLEGWAHSGVGESVLGPTGESILSVDIPGKEKTPAKKAKKG